MERARGSAFASTSILPSTLTVRTEWCPGNNANAKNCLCLWDRSVGRLWDRSVRRQTIDRLRQHLRQFLGELLDGHTGSRGHLLQQVRAKHPMYVGGRDRII